MDLYSPPGPPDGGDRRKVDVVSVELTARDTLNPPAVTPEGDAVAVLLAQEGSQETQGRGLGLVTALG